MGSRLTWRHGPAVSKAFFGPFLCVKAFFGPFLCGGTSQKKLGSVGAGVRRMGSHFTWPHGPPVSKAFFGPFLCAKAFFGPFLCGGMFQKKPWQCGGRCSVFWSGFFSDLSGIVPCQTYGFPFDLASWASSVEGFFWTLFVCEGFFWTLGRSKKNRGSGGAGVPFFGQAFFQTFLD